MQNPKIHTPYDGSSKPFAIGLKPLDLADWLQVDAHLSAYLDEKQRLFETVRQNIIVSEPDSETSQLEVLGLISDHICTKFPQAFTRTQDTVKIENADRTVNLNDETIPAIHRAASLIQEDLVIMRKDETGWRLVAASLCFPSAWNLLEKFGKPMHEIHAPVPGFGEGTRNAALISRMFDNLKAEQPVLRWNWSLYGDANLYHPVSDHSMKRRFGDNIEPENINLRLERQTLRKLPTSGDILFTIRIYINPLETLETHPDGPALAHSIAEQISALSDDEIAYKGLSDERPRLVKRLNVVAGLPPKG